MQVLDGTLRTLFTTRLFSNFPSLGWCLKGYYPTFESSDHEKTDIVVGHKQNGEL